jgi:hypothetical protein
VGDRRLCELERLDRDSEGAVDNQARDSLECGFGAAGIGVEKGADHEPGRSNASAPQVIAGEWFVGVAAGVAHD